LRVGVRKIANKRCGRRSCDGQRPRILPHFPVPLKTKRRTLLQQFGGIAAKNGFECGFSWPNFPASTGRAAQSSVTAYFRQGGAPRFRIEIFGN
jgi:hypothetical protein